MFQTGRNSSASYVSIPFEFNHDGAINKVSIDTEQSTPPGCSVFYSVAGIFDSGEETPYIPISPVGIDSSIGSSKIVTFGVNLEKNSKFVTDSAGPGSPQVYGTSFQGKEFYRVGPVFTKNPIFGKSKLYRGYKSWYRDTSGKFDIVNITDNYVNFSNSDLAYLYATGTEVPLVTALGLGVDGIARTKLSLTKPPYYDSSKGHLLKPEPGQDPSLDTQPMYAVYKVQVKGSSLRQSRQFILSANRTQYLPFTSFLVQGATTDLPILRTIGGTPFINGVDYTFELTSVGGVQKPTGRIVIPDGSSFLDPNGNVINVLVEFAYTIDIDITHKVSSIVGNDVTLDHSILTDLDGVQITYRYVPVSPNQILKPSVRVYSAISSTSNTTFYTEGRDYTINDRSGAIQKIPSGSISDKCYVKYSYRSSDSSLNTFTTWAYISPSDGTQIKFDLDPSTKKNKLVADFAAGESFLINTRNGIVNLTNATSTPVLAMGWVQFIVRSKDPDTNVIYRSNLIDQIIQLKDVNKKKIFNSYNMYFNEIIAFREPLIEKTLNHLKVNTLLADHSCFAIDNITDPFNSYIVLNFKPNETSELYCRVPTDDSDETSRPSVSNEEFLIEWSEETDVESRPTKIKVKIDLLRASEADGSLTPKVFKYSLRVGS
jgi:hypothetical protein